MRVFFRVLLPILFVIISLWCACHAKLFAWAYAAPPHERNAYFERWYLIWGSCALISFLLIFVSIYLLRPRTVAPEGQADLAEDSNISK